MNEEENVNVERLKDNKKPKGFLKSFFLKLKKIKHIEIILTVFFISIILLIYFSSFSFKTSPSDTKSGGTEQQVLYDDDNYDDLLLNYESQIEGKIKKVVCSLENVGQVNVAVNFNGNVSEVIAYTTKTEFLDDGTKVETKTPVLVTENGKTQPLILETIMPQLSNVIVVASGAKDTKVRLEIIRVIRSLFDLPNLDVEVFVGK